MHRLLSALLLFALVLVPWRAATAQALVAAASDLQFALSELADAFERDSGEPLRLVFGSSGNLTRQIANGAPFELFLSADEAYVERLVEGGHTRDSGALYAQGRLVLLLPAGSPLREDSAVDDLRLEDLGEAAAAGRLTRLAIANPEHAPYGQAAREALEASGVWEAVQPTLILGENVSQAAQFALSGAAQGGLVAYSLVLAPTMEGRGDYALVDEALHAPLRQRMVLTRKSGPVAEAFYDYLQTEEARDLLDRYGFTLPDGAE
ncbi:molybdate ABC transporter substrate-binding protein [Aquibaculum sediminis]|uniref:molybdate ABC transporter substrate-binding protein n=1 Tax=Aquibaculum sediminis TaxID=3231907 RepID=UPI0034538C11